MASASSGGGTSRKKESSFVDHKKISNVSICSGVNITIPCQMNHNVHDNDENQEIRIISNGSFHILEIDSLEYEQQQKREAKQAPNTIMQDHCINNDRLLCVAKELLGGENFAELICNEEDEEQEVVRYYKRTIFALEDDMERQIGEDEVLDALSVVSTSGIGLVEYVIEEEDEDEELAPELEEQDTFSIESTHTVVYTPAAKPISNRCRRKRDVLLSWLGHYQKRSN